MKYFIGNNFREYSIFFWLIFVAILAILTSAIHSKNKVVQVEQIKSSLDNIYLKKTIESITEGLEPRFTELIYISKSGDTYENIIANLKISSEEKKILLDSILKEKSLKILRVNQKFKFKKKEAYSSSLDSHTTTISFNQNLKMGRTSNLALTLNADFNVHKESPSSDTDEYKLTLSPSFSKSLFWNLSFSPSYSLTVINNVFNSTKGVESSHDPSMTITKSWGKLSANINYAYTKKISNDESSSYAKHILGFGLNYGL